MRGVTILNRFLFNPAQAIFSLLQQPSHIITASTSSSRFPLLTYPTTKKKGGENSSLLEECGTIVHLLLPFEEVFDVCNRVYMLNTHIWGSLFVTNFRLLFVTEDNTGGKSLVPLGTIALGTIDKFSKIHNISEESGSSLRGLKVLTKDLRVIVFGFVLHWKSRRTVFIELKRLIETSGLYDLYAFSCGVGQYHGTDPRERVHQEYLRILSSCEYDNAREKKSRNCRCRISNVNEDYSLCSTYPSVLMVPNSISDDELIEASSLRMKNRLPVITWCHPHNRAVLARSSQPKIMSMKSAMVMYIKSRKNIDHRIVDALLGNDHCKKMYIADARAMNAAFANVAKGGGSESNSSHYSADCEVVFFGIPNIHEMSRSFRKLRIYLDKHGGCCSDGEVSYMKHNIWSWMAGNINNVFSSLSIFGERGWLCHIHSLLANSAWIASKIAIEGASVLVHCSDGWDRTSQLVSLSGLMLDPYYRTFEGFQALVEKDWLAFGHQFATRLGMPTLQELSDNDDTIDRTNGINSEERSPIFLQWIDCVFQLLRIYPCAFEFSTCYLLDFLDLVLSSRFGNFLCNSEKERYEANVVDKCGCVWTYLETTRNVPNEKRHEHFSMLYDPDRHSGALIPPAAALAPTLGGEFHLRWAFPSHSYTDISDQCRMIPEG